jgi:multisubunit Na+/H+ antiporter MnhG subunit
VLPVLFLASNTGEVAVLVLVGLAFVITVPVLGQVIARAAHRANDKSDRKS